MFLICILILVALLFDFTNGFHDTANAIATVVGTKVLTPRQAILLATVTNLTGALLGASVAGTIAKGLVDSNLIPPAFGSEMVVCALVSAIAWNLLTWYFGLPSSSSHALIGGLVGSALGTAHGQWQVVIWSQPAAPGQPWWLGGGVLYKVIIPMVLSPAFGLLFGFVFMAALYFLLLKCRPSLVSRLFGWLQIGSAGYMGLAHGLNDAQKTMGIIAMALLAATKAGTFDQLPVWLDFLKMHEPSGGKPLIIAPWIKVICALAMAAGTASGGWRIIKTLGHKLVKLQPVQGFAAETAAATVLVGASHLGMPVSTTHVITTSIMGVGAARRINAVKWTVVQRIVWAWILTLPTSAALGYGLVRLVLSL